MKAVKKAVSFISALIISVSAVTAQVQAQDYPYYIKVNRQTQVTTIYTKDDSGNYTVPYKAMICAPGAGGNTPLGKFRTPEKYRWKELMGGVWGQYSTRFAGGCLFHSACYRRPDESTLITRTFNSLGSKESLGCVRLSVADAKWIYEHCGGSTIRIFDGTYSAQEVFKGPLGRRPLMYMPGDYDPTDPLAGTGTP